MWTRNVVDFIVMALLLLGPAVLLSSLDNGADSGPPTQPRATEISDDQARIQHSREYRF